MNIGIVMFLGVVFFSGYMPNSGILESYGRSVFSFLRSLHTVLYIGYASLHSHQHCKGVLFSTPSPALLFVEFFEDGHLADVRYDTLL